MGSDKITLQKIETLRHQLTQIVATNGLTDIKTIEISQELDRLLNAHNNLMKKKR